MTGRPAEAVDAFAVDPRSVQPNRRLDLYRTLAVATVASVLYAVALATEVLPPSGISITFFSAAPLCAAFALPILAVRSRAERDTALSWFTVGLAGALVAMVLQLISFPLVAPDGGVLGTSSQSSAALYLLFHLAPALGALAGALALPRSWRLPTLAGLVLLGFLFATDVVPMPYLLRPDGSFTGLLIAVEYVLAVVVAASAALWIVRVGRAPLPLRAWVGVALSLSVYDLAFNALGAERFTSVWWASLSLRVGTYGVLAVGSMVSLLSQLRDLEAYSDLELGRREGQLRHSLKLTSQLLTSADDLAQAVTTAEVADVLSADAMTTTGRPHAVVLLLNGQDEHLRVATELHGHDGHPTWDGRWRVPLEGMWSTATSGPVFLDALEDRFGELPGTDGTPLLGAGSLALLPLRAGEETLGLLVVWDQLAQPWTGISREVLLGLASQGSQAIARARAFESEREAAQTLQRSLLPPSLPHLAGISLSARYLPGERGLQVGGDWYDVVEVSDHEVALVVGDVMGKGLHAAAVMGQLRTTLRALAVVDPAPTSVLNALDRLTSDLDVDEIATIVYVLLDLCTGRSRVARAGHLPPLLVTRYGPPTLIHDGSSPPLGAPVADRPSVELTVPPGSLWVLYTDGIVEDRVSGLDRGLPDLVAAVTRLSKEHRMDTESIATGLLARVEETDRPDDIALLVAGFTGIPAPTGRTARVTPAAP